MLLCVASTLNLECYSSPAGAVAWPWRLEPQQATEPSDRSPHVWYPPLLMAVKVSPDGALWPSYCRPQQATEPLDRSPHVCNPPLLTAVKVYPAGAVAWPW